MKKNHDNFYSSSKTEIIVNKSDNDDVLQSMSTTTISHIQKYFAKGSG